MTTSNSQNSPVHIILDNREHKLMKALVNYSDFYLHCYYVIAKLGLQLKAREEDLFASEKWSIPECKDGLMKEIEKFLIKHVK